MTSADGAKLLDPNAKTLIVTGQELVGCANIPAAGFHSPGSRPRNLVPGIPGRVWTGKKKSQKLKRRKEKQSPS